MATNRVTVNITSDQNGGLCLPDTEPSSESRTPTLANVQQGVSFFTDSQEDRIKMLEYQLEEAKLENLEWQKMILEAKSLKDLIKKLEGKRQGKNADLNDHPLQGAPSIRISVDTADDRNIAILRENAVLKEHLRKLESVLNSSGKDLLECQHVKLCRMHPESCPSSVSMDSGTSNDSADLSAEHEADKIYCPVADISNTRLAPSRCDVPPSGIVKATKEAAVAAAAASQCCAFEKLQSESLKTAEDSDTVKVIRVASVTIDMIGWLSENVSWLGWKPLLLKLGLSDVTIEEVIKSHPSSIREQRYQGFLAWKKTQPSGATVPALLQAMRDKSLHQLSRDFCKQHRLDYGGKLAKKRSVVRQRAFEADSMPSDFDRSMPVVVNRETVDRTREKSGGFCLYNAAEEEVEEEAPLKNRTSTLQSIQQDLAAFAESKDDTIRDLKSELAVANQLIQELQVKANGHTPSLDVSSDASGDSNIRTLRKENTGLKEQLRQRKSMMNSSQKLKLGRMHPESCPSSVSIDSNS